MEEENGRSRLQTYKGDHQKSEIIPVSICEEDGASQKDRSKWLLLWFFVCDSWELCLLIAAEMLDVEVAVDVLRVGELASTTQLRHR